MRVCLLADDTGIREYFLSSLKYMVSNTNAEISLVIVNQDSLMSAQSTREAVAGGLISTVSFLRQQFTETPSYLKRQELDSVSILNGIEQIQAKPIPVDGELGHTIPKKIVDKIENETDLVIRHGFGILRGRILSGPKHGVLSFHHGDIREYRGAAQGFWNFVYDESTAGVTLQRLTPQLDGGQVVAFREINIEDCFTWQEVRARLFEASIPMLAEGIQNINNSDFTVNEPESLGDLRTTSDMYRPTTLVRYLLKNNSGRIKKSICRWKKRPQKS